MFSSPFAAISPTPLCSGEQQEDEERCKAALVVLLLVVTYAWMHGKNERYNPNLEWKRGLAIRFIAAKVITTRQAKPAHKPNGHPSSPPPPVD